MKWLTNLSLSMKFLPPLLGGTLVTIVVGGILITQEAMDASLEQTGIAKAAFTVEQGQVKTQLTDSLISKSDSIGRFIAKVSPDLIISFDFTALKAFQLEAAKDPDVQYVGFLKPDNKSALIEYQAVADKSKIIERRYEIKNKQDLLGFVVLGMSTQKIEDGIKTSTARISSAINQVQNSAHNSLNRLFTIMGITTCAVMAIITGLLFFLFRYNVIRPLRESSELIRGLAAGNGDLTVKLPVHGNDEINQLRIAMNAFVESLRNMIQIIVAEVIVMRTESQNMNDFSVRLSHQSDQQRTQTTQVATAMNQMVATVQQVASNVAEAATAANQGRDEAIKGKSVVGNAVASIRHLSQEVENAAQVILELEKSSEKIGSVLDVINGIAEQTNLLALNAAIEAARAGEQGRGFAVVADEVRTLASRTHKSTLEIREMIERVQSGTSSAVSVMRRGQTAAKDSVSLAEKAGVSLESINGVVQTINQMTLQIASAAEEQHATAEEINRNIDSIHNISEETAKDAEISAKATLEMSELSNRLHALVGQFKV